LCFLSGSYKNYPEHNVDHPEYALNKFTSKFHARKKTKPKHSQLAQLRSFLTSNSFSVHKMEQNNLFTWAFLFLGSGKCYSEKWPIIKQWLHLKVQFGGIVYKDWLLLVTYLQTKGPPSTQRRFPFGSAPLLTDSSKNYRVD